MSNLPRLSVDEEDDRFARFRLIGWWDQNRLANARVVLIGAGALGNEILKNLALLGVGNVFVADLDLVEISNLSRSVLFRAEDRGLPKAEVAARRAADLYPGIRVRPFHGNVVHDLGLGVYRWADVILGGLDNREARVAINRAAARTGKVWIDGAIERLDGVARVFDPASGPCYECTMSAVDWKMLESRRSCALLSRDEMRQGKVPTTPTTASVVAGIQCQEAVKLLHGTEVLAGRGFVFEGTRHESYVVTYTRNEDCPSHEAYDPVATLPSRVSETRVGDFLERVRADLGPRAVVEMNSDLLESLDCVTCGECGSYDCAPARRESFSGEQPSIRITGDDLAAARPLATPTRPVFAPVLMPPEPSGMSRTAVASLIVAVAGIPLFGLVTGLVAIVLGSIALGGIHMSRRRGTGFAIAGIVLGMLDVVGWLIFLTIGLRGVVMPHVELADFEPDESMMEGLSPAMQRAMRANVLVEWTSNRGLLGGSGMGSGVVVGASDGRMVIVTNRHVVDPEFTADHSVASETAGGNGSLEVKLFGQAPRPGRVVWIAPDGIDLALVEALAMDDDVCVAPWRTDSRLAVGMEVFAIGNPCGLGWTHSPGVISQLRRQKCGNRRIRVIQTNAAINPGNSGGGLYDRNGILIGINTWTNDKRISEGLGFAIAWESLLELNPARLEPVLRNGPLLEGVGDRP